MTILPVGNYEGTMCEENLLEDFDILVAIGQNSDAMLRKLAKERGIALISLAIDNFDSLNLNCAPTGGSVTSLLTRDERERIERISEGVLVILIAEGILKLINLIF